LEAEEKLARRNGTEVTLNLAKDLENEFVDISVNQCGFRFDRSFTSLSEATKDSIEASLRLAKQQKVEKPKEETAEEKVAKPEEKAVKKKAKNRSLSEGTKVEMPKEETAEEKVEKVKEPVEKLEETEVTLNLVKDLENEFVDISVITVVSDSIEASVRLAKEPRLTKRTEKRKDETVDGKNLSAAESWYAINKSGPETEFDVHLPAMNAFLCNDATVSLCVEKPAEMALWMQYPHRPVSVVVASRFISLNYGKLQERTQKIGVGTIFNSERPTEQIELAEEIIRPSPHNEAVKLLPLREKCSACLSFCIGKKTKNEDTVDIDVTVIPETERERSKERSRSVIADIEVDAGEEMATTDAIVDVLTSFEESELAITEFLSDILDVDVTLDALMEEEFIEAIGPAFHSQLASLVVQMPTVVTAISQLIEEVKLLAANAETEILMPVANKTEMQQLTLTLQKADYESHENFKNDEKLKDVGKESQDIDEEKKEKPKVEVEKRKKKVPKALVIPAEISTKYGDKSTLLSETTMTTEIAMNEVMAEVEISPKKSLSASVAMKVDSAKRRKSVSHRSSSAEKFTFKDIEEGTELKIAEENVRKTKKRTGLPPVPKTKEEIEVELIFGQKEYRENIEDIFPVKLVEELVNIVQVTAKSRKRKIERAGKDLEEQKQGKKSIDELGKIETVKLTPITKEIEKQETYERARKKRIGFIQAPDKEVIAFRGDTIKIECELLNEDDFMWLINDKPASEDLRCIEEVNSLIRTLTIRNIVPEDEETIIVAKVGDIVAETIIHVEDTPAEIIEPLPRRSFGKCGENVTLAVSVTHPAHSIVWEFNGEKLPQDDGNYMIAEEGNIYTLTIKDATYNDAGRYSIKVDSLETSTTLVMQGAPIIEKPEPESINFETHENLLLSIPYKAVPEPTIDCFFNNEPLLVGTKLKLEIINDMVQFCKRKINKNDSGEYTFKISNEFGEAVKTFTVNVKGISGVPENPRIMDISLDRVSVEWDAPKDDGGSKIIGYIIQKKEIGRRTFHHVIQVTGDKTNYLIEELDADTDYIFRVAAINKYGTGEFAEFPLAHTSAAPEELEEIPEQEKELEKISERVDEDQELAELKKAKAKKLLKKDGSKKAEQLEEEMEQAIDKEIAVGEDISQAKPATERKVEMTDLKECVETVKDLEQHDVELKVGKAEKEELARVTRPEEEIRDEVVAMDKTKVEKSDTVEAEERKLKKTKRKKPKKEEKSSEEMIPTVQKKSVDLVEDNMNKVLEVEIIEGNELKEKFDEEFSQEEKKHVEIATESEIKETFEIKDEKEEEIDVSDISDTVIVDKKTEKVALEKKPTAKKREEIKKKKSSKGKSQKTTAKKAEEPTVVVGVTDESFDVQFQKQDIIVEDMTTSEKVKIEAEKEEIKKDHLEDGYVEDRSKVKKKKEQHEIEVFFKNTSNVANVDKIISILGSKDATSASVKADSKKKSKTSKRLIKEKLEEIVGTKEEKFEAEKLEAKLEIDDKVGKPEHGEVKDEGDVLKRLDSGQEVKEAKAVEDKEAKPKKKVTGKKIAKKALQKPKVEEEIGKKSRDEAREEKHIEEKKVNRFKDEEVEELKSSADIDVTINIPAVLINEEPGPEETIEMTSVLRKDETPITRRVHKRPSGFVLLPDQEILAFRNDTVKIECEVFNEEDKINWMINGKLVTDDIRCTEVEDGYLRILQIENVVPEDTGMIITANLHEHSAESRLIVEDIPVEITEKLPHKITGKMDDFIKLSITVSHPTENCQWFFNNEQLIKNNDHYEVNVEGNVYSLLIKNLSYDQAGRYSVKVESAETSTILTVEGAPILHETETIVTTVDLESQDNLILTIPFKAIPEPTLECFLNNEKIPSSSKIQLDIFNDKACFRKRKVDKSDTGEYTIKIKNDFGEVSQTFSVNVKDVPGLPENGHITDIGSCCATIHWNAPSDDGGSAITGYIVEKREESRRTYHRVAQVSSEEMDYYVDDLKINTSYMIRIAAMNKYGIGEYLECASFRTCLPFKAPSVTHPPVITNVTDQSCTLKWPRVTEDGGSPIYGYDLFIRENKSDWMKVNDELIFTEQFTVSNIEAGLTYEFKVEATNEAGLTSKSDVISEPLIISKAAELPILIAPTVEVVSGDAVRVQWIEVTSENWNVTSYVIMYKSENSSLWLEKEIEHSPADITGLREELSYLFKVAPKSGPTIGEFSEETTPIRIIAAKKPEITKGIKDVSVSRKRELKLECHATGEPVPQYIWYKADREIIPASENIEIINEGFMSTLFIHHTSEMDAGLYKCEVVNDLGSVDSQAIVTVTEVRAHFVSSFPEYLEINEGEEIGFSCELSDADASVVWLKDGKPLRSDDRIMIKEDGTERKLTIRNAVLEDGGRYVCSTIDKRTQSEAELVVKEELPHIKRGPQDQVVTEFGTTIVLKCETTKPVKTVKWFRNRKEIWLRQEKFNMNVKETIATLTIMNFELNDCGEYTAALREDEESAPAKVELKIAPTIKLLKNLPSNVLKLHCGIDFDIEFVYEGFPEVDIRTTLNDKPLNKMRSRMHTYDNKLSLRLKNIIQEDSGILKVVVENEIGSASEEIQLDVISVPSKPRHLTAFNITSRSVMLKWEKAEDNGSPITNYIIERRTADIKRWRNIGKCESEQYEFLVEDLYPSESYSFRIVAVNEVGEGAPSNVVDVVTVDESGELEEITKLLPAPSSLKATLVEDDQTALITWEIVEEAEEYIIERSKLENDWEQVGVTTEPKFDDSFDESLNYKYRIIAKKGDQLSSPSEETEIVTVPAHKEKEEKQQEMIETERQETEERKSEKADDQVKQEKTAKKVAKKKKNKQEGEDSNGTAAIVEKLEDEPEGEEMRANEKAKMEVITRKKKPKKEQEEENEVGIKIEDEFKPSEKVIEENEEKVGSRKTVKKKAQGKGKKEAEKEELSKDEVEREKDFEQEKIEVEKEQDGELNLGGEIHKMNSEKNIEKKGSGKVKQEDERITEDGKSKKKKKSKQEPEETVEQKSGGSISQVGEVLVSGLVTEKKEEETEEETMRREKLEVKPANSSVMINNGTKNFELIVNIIGNYDECYWTKDEKRIDKMLVKTSANTSVLRLEDVDELTKGLYQCIATNKMEKAIAEIDVTVTEKPKIEFEEATIGAKTGEMLKIYANVTGLPMPTCKWLKDGAELKTDENTIITFKEGVAVVTIKKAVVGNSGLYKLMVENTCGKQEDQVKVLIKGVPSAPVGPLQVSDVTNASCKLAWNPPEQDGNSKLLGYCIEKRDAKKSSWAFVARTTTTTATITSLSDNSKYYFRVVAENAFGTGPALENEEPIQPIKITAIEKPKIKKAPGKETGKVGDKLTLSVEFVAKPVPEVRWYRNGEELFHNVDNTIIKMDKKSMLTIEKLIEDDEGDYQIVVENEGGTAEHKFNVEVKSKPMIIDAGKYKEPQVFNKGENVKLQLAFTG
uniref:non-specific serine/threonine protein kinase n=1 Tax=Loa loa TaxID=7209 RepID=A0A1I7VXR7_LOALO